MRLPHHVFAAAAGGQQTKHHVSSGDQDWKLFLLSFTAFFTVIYTFIA